MQVIRTVKMRTFGNEFASTSWNIRIQISIEFIEWGLERGSIIQIHAKTHVSQRGVLNMTSGWLVACCQSDILFEYSSELIWICTYRFPCNSGLWWRIYTIVNVVAIVSYVGSVTVRLQAITWIIVAIDSILPEGPYLPCLRMADEALLAGYLEILVVAPRDRN